MKNLIIITLAILICSCGKTENFNTNSNIGKSGSMARFVIHDNSLYIVDSKSLRTFDITNNSFPDSIGVAEIGIGIETIFPYKNALFIGSQDGMHIFDITNRLKPEKLSTYRHIFSCDPVVADDQYAYVTLRSGSTCRRGENRLDIVDITDLKNPHFATSKNMRNPKGLAIDKNNLFICDEGIKVIDVSDKSDLLVKKHFQNISSYDVIQHNNKLFVIGDDGLVQYRYQNDSIFEISRLGVYYN